MGKLRNLLKLSALVSMIGLGGCSVSPKGAKMKNRALLILISVLGLTTSAWTAHANCPSRIPIAFNLKVGSDNTTMCCPEGTVALCNGECCKRECNSAGNCPCPDGEKFRFDAQLQKSVCCPSESVASCNGICCPSKCNSEGKCPTCPEGQYPIPYGGLGKWGCCPNADDKYAEYGGGCCPKRSYYPGTGPYLDGCCRNAARPLPFTLRTGTPVCCPEGTVGICNDECCKYPCDSEGKCPACPRDEYGNQGKLTTKDGETDCCFDYERWDESNQKYQNGHEFCGCPSGQEAISDDECCDSNKVIGEGTNKVCCRNEIANDGDKKICCAPGTVVALKEDKTGEKCVPKDEDDGVNELPCTNVITTKDGTKKCCESETQNESELCPCDPGEVKASYFKFSDGRLSTSHTYKCCPSDKPSPAKGSGECCTEDKKYTTSQTFQYTPPADDPRGWLKGRYRFNFFTDACCSKGTLIDYQTFDTVRRKETLVKICCDSVPSCDPKKGVIYQDDSGKCQCGCYNNYDCNLNWKEGDTVHVCLEDHTCSFSFDISGIEVEIQDFAGGQLTREKVESLVKKVRQDLLASAGIDNLKIIFSGKIVDPIFEEDEDGNITRGYSKVGDGQKIYVNSGYCNQEKDFLRCSSTIIHENVHRVSNLKQPNWGQGRQVVKDIYQTVLDETVAHATQGIRILRNVFEKCFLHKNGKVASVCDHTSFAWNKDLCESECKPAKEDTRYLLEEGLDTLWRAEEYYENPEFAAYNNCEKGSLFTTLQEDFLKYYYPNSLYISDSKKLATAVSSVLPVLQFPYSQISEKISEFRTASFLPLLGLASGTISRIGFLWNSNPTAPSLVSEIADLYSKHGHLCISGDEFVNKVNLGFEKLPDLNTYEEAYDFVKANPECKYEKPEDIGACQEKLDCVTNQWGKGCWPIVEWASHVDQIETYTID